MSLLIFEKFIWQPILTPGEPINTELQNAVWRGGPETGRPDFFVQPATDRPRLWRAGNRRRKPKSGSEDGLRLRPQPSPAKSLLKTPFQRIILSHAMLTQCLFASNLCGCGSSHFNLPPPAEVHLAALPEDWPASKKKNFRMPKYWGGEKLAAPALSGAFAWKI
jgi:hypothetical protein